MFWLFGSHVNAWKVTYVSVSGLVRYADDITRLLSANPVINGFCLYNNTVSVHNLIFCFCNGGRFCSYRCG